MESVAKGVRQQNAIELLAGGTSVSETAKRLKVSRRTIERWVREPHFAADLNRRRQELWSSAHDRSRLLVHRALDVFESELKANNLGAARDVLRQFGPLLAAGAASIGSDDPAQLQREQALNQQLGSMQGDLLAALDDGHKPLEEVL
jgi:hypothetical protein